MAHKGAPFIPDNTEVATIATANAVTSLTGDVTGTGPGATATTLANTAVTPASYTNANITVDAKGRITAAANGTDASGITQLTGDVTAGPGTGSQVASLAAGSASVLNSGTLLAARMPALTGDVTTSAGAVATAIGANKVLDTMLRDSAALSVIGRSANSTGDPADIAGTDTQVLRVAGTALGFGTVVAGGIASDAVTTAKILDANVTYAKVQNVAALSVVGRSANSSGVSADITGTDGQALRVSGTTLGFGTIVAAGIASDAVTTAKILDANVTLAKMANLAQSVVVGRNTASTGVPEAVTMAQLRALLGLEWNSVAVAGSATQNLASTLTFPADGSDLEFEGKIVGPNATITWTIELNALATNQASQIFGAETAASFTAQSTNIYIADDTTTASVYFYGRVVQIAGIERQIILHTFQISGSTVCFTTIARWNVTTAITALRVHASTGTGLGIGTTLRTRVA